MNTERRTVLRFGGIAAVMAIAGCSGDSGEPAGNESSTEDPGSGERAQQANAVESAVAAELNVYRSRLYDTVALARADNPEAGAAVTSDIFARFEQASGETGAHEMLEKTSEEAYEGFEGALESLRDALESEDRAGAVEAAETGAAHLRTAQRQLVGESAVPVLDVLAYGSRAANAAALAGAEYPEAASQVATETLADFEAASVHDELATASSEAYETFEGNLESVASTGTDPAEKRETASASIDGAIDGAYALGPESLAGACHMALYQARGWDGAAVTRLGGPGTPYAHAATLNIYRARAYDTHWIGSHGAPDVAGTMAEDIFAHFEGARAHDGLEEADKDAYEGFEDGLSELQTALEAGDADGVDGAIETVDSNLVVGIEKLSGDDAPLLQAGFFAARFGDARELSRQGHSDEAASIVEGLFQRFEANELGFHETLEATSESLYESFEDEHLTALVEAYEGDDSAAIETHHNGVLESLVQFESEYSAALASGAETSYLAARGFDAAGVDALGDSGRAGAIAEAAFTRFESDAGGYHEQLETASEESYEAFERALAAVRSTAEQGKTVYPAAVTLNDETVQSMYDIAASGGSAGGADVLSDVFASFEQTRVHDMLEEADRDSYENFEETLTAYQSDLEAGSTERAGTFADASRTAQFAVAGAVDAAPSADLEEGGEEETDLEGGPNVVEGVPEDADHVVKMNAVAFEPEELTIQQGDTVAFEFAAGEPHSVSAYSDGIPADAEYWASGGFDSEAAAREGWKKGSGAVQSGQSYVRTFEAVGTHEYFCIPHEAAGMVGKIVVEG